MRSNTAFGSSLGAISATPKEQVICCWEINWVLSTFVRSFSARNCAFCRGVSLHRMTNSSPPQRTRASVVRIRLRISLERFTRTSSPTLCPQVSLTFLKKSMSSMMNESAPPPLFKCSCSWVRTLVKPALFRQPVKASSLLAFS